MRRLMQHMIFSSQPKHTLYSELLDAISIFGRRRLIVEDMKQVEQTLRPGAAGHARARSARQPPRGRERGGRRAAAQRDQLRCAGDRAQRIPARSGDAQLHGRRGGDPERLHRGAREDDRHLAPVRRDREARTRDRRAQGRAHRLPGRSARRVRSRGQALAHALGDALSARGRRPVGPARSGSDPLHVGLGRAAERRGALPSRDPFQHRAGARRDRLLARGQGAERAARVPLVRAHRGHAAAAAHGRAVVPVPQPAALPRDPGDRLRPQLHRAARHQHVSRQLRARRASVRFLPPALRRRRRGEGLRGGAAGVVREVRRAHPRRLRRDRDRAGARREHADGLSLRHRGSAAARRSKAGSCRCRESIAAGCCTCADRT